MGDNDGRPAAIASSALRFGKGEAIYSQGDAAGSWFEVLGGIVRTCRFHADGRRQLTGFFYSGDVFGVDEDTYRETAEAVTPVVVRRHALAPNGRAPAAPEMQGVPLRRALHSAQECIFLLGHRTAAERVAAFLLAIAERLPAAEQLLLPMSRGDIADHLGLTMHTVSRTISDLARQELIAVDSPLEIRILNLASLRALTGDGDEDPADFRASFRTGEDFQAA
jgi:CRP/FNR family transcriptional regulator/CRP/FNR family nitrogen fixation transcriptional regulator